MTTLNKILILIHLSVCILILVKCADSEASHTQISNLSDQEIVDFIAINFLAHYGGAELERQSVCSVFASSIEDCELDSTLSLNLGHSDTNYQMTLIGEYKVSCPNDFDEKSYQFSEQSSSIGNANMDDINQEFSFTHNTLITGSPNNGDYSIQGKGSRSVNYKSPTYKNLSSSLFFNYVNFFNYNMEDCDFNGDTHYNFRFKITHNNLNSDHRTVTGTIDLEEEEWVLKSDDGIYAILY